MKTKQAIEIIETSLVAEKHLTAQGLNCEPLIMAHEAALQALREKEERENPKPLPLEELIAVNEEPVWIWFIDAPGRWVIRSSSRWVDISYPERMSLFNMKWYKHSAYGVDWMAYRYKPKGGMIRVQSH